MIICAPYFIPFSVRKLHLYYILTVLPTLIE